MSNSFRIDNGSLFLKPLSAPPSSPKKGEAYVDETTGVLNVYNGTQWVALDGSGGGDYASAKILNTGNVSWVTTASNAIGTLVDPPATRRRTSTSRVVKPAG